MIQNSEVLKAAKSIVAAFGSHDSDAYFAAFHTDATFIFHNTREVLYSKMEYLSLWKVWESQGFHVVSCRSIQPFVHVLSDEIAIFTHSVETEMKLGDEKLSSHERETIVFVVFDGKWLAVHEHLSPDPNFSS